MCIIFFFGGKDNEKTIIFVSDFGNGFGVGEYDSHVREFWRFEKVNVTPGILLYNQPSYVKIGTTHTVIAAVAEETMLYQDVSWTSSNESVAKVSKGTITAVGAGEAQITVKSTTNSTWKKVFTIDVTYVNEGTYFLRNPQVSKVITATGSGLSAFDNGDDQEYVFEYYVDGYFRIKSVYSGLYLTVEGNSTAKDAAVIHSAWDDATGQLWKIFPTANGRYKLSTMAVEDANISNVLCATNNSTLKQDEWLNNDSYYDEWIIVEIKTIVLDSRYDDSFESLMSEGMIPTISDSFIAGVENDVITVLERILPIRFVGSDSIEHIQTSADTAPHTGSCADHLGECISHHKNIYAYTEQIYSQRNADTVYISWMDHTDLCMGTDYVHEPVPDGVLGLVFLMENGTSYPVINILNIRHGSHRSIAAFLTLIHEIAHVLGLPEQYIIDDIHANGLTDCVMARYPSSDQDVYTAIKYGNRTALCDECIDMLWYSLVDFQLTA